MAKNNLTNYKDADGLGFPLNFRRGNPNPLDNSSVWATLAKAQEYAQTSAVSYVGQILSVLSDDGNSVTIYSIQNEAGTLKEVGTVPVGDGNSITVEDGKIKILGIDGAETGASLVKGENGKVKWVKIGAAGSADVDNKSIEISDSALQIKGFKAATEGQHLVKKGETAVWEAMPDVYTKDEVNGLVSSVYKYKGSVETYSALPAENNTVGDVWNVSKADKANGIKAGDNVAWTEDGWDVLAGTVDLSDYSTTEAINTKLDTKVDKVTGKGLSEKDFTAALETKLTGIEEGAQVNKIETVDETQLAISKDKKLSITALDKSKVTGLDTSLTDINTAIDGKVDKVEGKGLSTNDLTDELKAKYDVAEANVIKKIMLGETEATPDESKVVTIPAATAAALGLVKSSDAENAVAVAADGVMTVNNINVNKLVQTAGDTLIIDGGSLE